MEVILLENIKGLGKLGDTVEVKAGFARNFLLPQEKALKSSKDNLAYFETKKAELEKKEIERTKDLELIANKLQEANIIIKMKASDEGHLYGSVTSELVMNALGDLAKSISKHMVVIPHGQIRKVGAHNVEFKLSDAIDFTKEISVEKE